MFIRGKDTTFYCKTSTKELININNLLSFLLKSYTNTTFCLQFTT
jgi:hypothetical protein